MYSQLTGVLIPCAHPLTFTQSISVKIRLARPYWNKPVFSRPIRCRSRMQAKRNRHTLNFSARDRSEVHTIDLQLARLLVWRPSLASVLRPFFRKNGYRQVRSPSRTATKLGRTRPELPTGRPTKFGSRRSEGPHPSRRLGTSGHVILLWPGHRIIMRIIRTLLSSCS